MNRLLPLLGMLVALMVAFPAAADRDDSRRSQRYEQRDDRRGYERERGAWRDGGSQRERGFERGSRGERLSPDERRQLRRDIEHLGRDVYRDRGRSGSDRRR